VTEADKSTSVDTSVLAPLPLSGWSKEEMVEEDGGNTSPTPKLTEGATGGVSGNESCGGGYACLPPTWTPFDLGDARALELGGVPFSPRATALVAALTAGLISGEVRGNRRGKSGLDKLHRAVGAVVGGVLLAWGRDNPRVVYRPLQAATFTGGLVPKRQFDAAVEGLAVC
jgi:hypothetical protein